MSTKDQQRRYYALHPEKRLSQRVASATWRKNNPDKVLAYRERTSSRWGTNIRALGFNVEKYNELLRLQGGRCAICRAVVKKHGKRLAVDHNHRAGFIRGLLCLHCNRGIGLFFDRPELLETAAEYLRTFSEKSDGGLADMPNAAN